MNNKADLRENMVGIIIGVLCLVLIFWFGVMLYNQFKDQEQQNAKSLVSSISEKLDALPKDGSGRSLPFSGFSNADNWFLFGWNANEASSPDVNSPDVCQSKACLCICKNKFSGAGSLDTIAIKNICETQSFCKTFNVKNLNVQTEFKRVASSDTIIEKRIDLQKTAMDFKLIATPDTYSVIFVDPNAHVNPDMISVPLQN